MLFRLGLWSDQLNFDDRRGAPETFVFIQGRYCKTSILLLQPIRDEPSEAMKIQFLRPGTIAFQNLDGYFL